MQLRVQLLKQQRPQNIKVLRENVHDGVEGMVASGGHPFSLFGVLLGQLHVVKYAEQHLEQVPPPVRLEAIAVRLDYFEEYGEGARADVQFAAIHHAAEREEQWEPAAHPHAVRFRDRHVVLHARVVGEEMRRRTHALRAHPHQSDGFHAGVGEAGVAGELRQALDRVLERVNHGRKLSGVQVGDDFAGRLEGQLDDGLFLVTCTRITIKIINLVQNAYFLLHSIVVILVVTKGER